MAEKRWLLLTINSFRNFAGNVWPNILHVKHCKSYLGMISCRNSLQSRKWRSAKHIQIQILLQLTTARHRGQAHFSATNNLRVTRSEQKTPLPHRQKIKDHGKQRLNRTALTSPICVARWGGLNSSIFLSGLQFPLAVLLYLFPAHSQFNLNSTSTAFL